MKLVLGTVIRPKGGGSGARGRGGVWKQLPHRAAPELQTA